ncbi:hypothetical protein [Aquimarina sp. RZ0]|uniref:hypothetical protein n=1 Tax=Aquimarina sp. RZ0 TaxID=2607730 RepID=UPI0011F3642D|nr:hypothetical protein [Aquimarina sp. RZ0]KAA1246831.1 hypothetical protein F0000_06115 [Aquimarina sp. RZ0]
MTLQHLIDWFGQHEYIIAVYFGIVLAFTVLVTLLINKKNSNFLQYVMSVLVYAVTVPGILSFILLLYALIILKTNILTVSIIAYFVPIIATILVLFILNKKVRMSTIPGFGRLSGLLILICITFAIVFILQKTYFGVLFIGGFMQLIAMFFAVFILLKIAWNKIQK